MTWADEETLCSVHVRKVEIGITDLEVSRLLLSSLRKKKDIRDYSPKIGSIIWYIC